MNFKGKISSLVLATTFGVGMVSSGLASAQNGGVLPSLPVSGEDIVKEDNFNGEVNNRYFAFTEETDGKDDSVVGEQGGLFAADGKNPDEVQKDDFIASGETGDASAAIENLSEEKSEEKSEVNNEPLAPAKRTNGEGSQIISEQDDLLSVSVENSDETQKDDFNASGKTSDASALAGNLGE